MKYLKTMTAVVVLLSVCVFSTSCSNAKAQAKKSGLQIYQMSTATGSVEDNNFDKQRLSYSIFLTNEDDTPVYIKTIEPVIGSGIAKRVLSDKISSVIDKTIEPKQNLEIKGEIIFDSKELSKEDIVKLGPYITEVKITSEKTIQVKL